jgi:hypothetical protein
LTSNASLFLWNRFLSNFVTLCSDSKGCDLVPWTDDAREARMHLNCLIGLFRTKYQISNIKYQISNIKYQMSIEVTSLFLNVVRCCCLFMRKYRREMQEQANRDFEIERPTIILFKSKPNSSFLDLTYKYW